MTIHPLVDLMRRFVIDWLDRADEDACRDIMTSEYTAVVGGVVLEGREEAYIPATMGQLRRFPGLMLTVHELFTAGDQVALRFTEHGASHERQEAAAAWAGIGIFTWDGQQLTTNVTEEDYLARRRQLATRSFDPVATPATSPWSASPQSPDENAEAAVLSWLTNGDLSSGGGVSMDDGWTGQPTPTLLDPYGIEIDSIFSAGRDVAFHATQHGIYRGGIDLPVETLGVKADLRVTGMVRVAPSGDITGHLVRDRVGLRRDLLAIVGST